MSTEAVLEERRIDARRNHEQIIDGAIRVLGEHPGASLQEIAAEAGLHRATLHRHFRSREDLLVAIRRRGVERVLRTYDDVEAMELEPGEALAVAARRILEGALPDAVWTFGTYYGEGADEYRPEMTERGTALVAAAQRAGAVRSDMPPRTLYAVWGGTGYAMLPLVRSGVLDLDGAVEVVLATLRGAA